ncbi:hypothetical protein TKK_0019183 [Trichogramma kaykai]
MAADTTVKKTNRPDAMSILLRQGGKITKNKKSYFRPATVVRNVIVDAADGNINAGSIAIDLDFVVHDDVDDDTDDNDDNDDA